MKKVLSYLSHLFGFEKLSEYERNYLHDKNIQGSLYIGYLTIALEIWMLIRQSVTKIIPKYKNGGSLFELLVKYTPKYWLVLLFGLGLVIFCLSCRKDRDLTKGRFIALLTVGSACML